MSHRRIQGHAVLIALVILSSGSTATAADKAAPTIEDFKRLEADLARVQQELREQRQLVFQLMSMHEALLKYLQGGGAPAGAASTFAAPPPPAATASAPAGTAPRAEGRHAGGSSESGTVTGRVRTKTGGVPAEAYVYLDGPRTSVSHPPTVEIKQSNRQFVPAVAVLPAGAKVVFPNTDAIFHNVFSNTPGDAFDLGPLKAGQTSAPVTFLKPGHVEIFCNIHSKMRADLLVVPNSHWIRVKPDGTFTLPSVPVGSRRIVLWGPEVKPNAQQIEVTTDGASVTFDAEARALGPHPNKTGAAYGSYEN
jgi:plastocyanin